MTRILVVDDDRGVTEFITDNLSEKGYETVSAYDGVEAVLKIMDEKVDCVLLDIRLPNLDGVNALRIIRKLRPGLAVLVFSGQAGRGDVVEAIRQGAFTCLLKPIRIEELLNTLKMMLGEK